jgi:hypothetical protein
LQLCNRTSIETTSFNYLTQLCHNATQLHDLVERRFFKDMSEDLTVTLEPETVTPELDRDLESVAENASVEPSGGAAADPPIMSVVHATDSPMLPQRRFVKPKLVPETAND